MCEAGAAPGGEPGPGQAAAGDAGGEPGPAGRQPGPAQDHDGPWRGWIWGVPAGGIDATAPLQALLVTATRAMGAFYASTMVQTDLRISPAGLGVLQVLLADDGLKTSDVAARGWSSPGTLTSVVDTLVRAGYVERRRDPGDRRVVRLYVTGPGRQACADYLARAGPRWRAAFDFVSPADEPVIRKFFIDMISQFSELTGEERGSAGKTSTEVDRKSSST
jgi:DNA-binding MarR family transcriptional regulator